MKGLSRIFAVFLAGAALAPAEAPRAGRDEGAAGSERGERGTHRKERRAGDASAVMMRRLDTDRSGGITYEEFSASEKLQALPERGRRRLFDRLDKDGDGEIRRKELPGRRMHRPHWDPNRDGRISRREFLENPRLSRMPLEGREAMFRRMDRDQDGFLTRSDWRGGPHGFPRGKGRPPFHSPEVFAELDRDGNGSLTFEEWKNHARRADRDEERLRALFRRLDRNGDGQLDSEDRPQAGGRRPRG